MKDPMRKAEAHLRTMNASSLQTHRFSMSHPSLYGGARRRECFEMAKSRNWHVCVNARRGDSKPDTRMHNRRFCWAFLEKWTMCYRNVATKMLRARFCLTVMSLQRTRFSLSKLLSDD
jgi:hypothetical protein